MVQAKKGCLLCSKSTCRHPPLGPYGNTSSVLFPAGNTQEIAAQLMDTKNTFVSPFCFTVCNILIPICPVETPIHLCPVPLSPCIIQVLHHHRQSQIFVLNSHYASLYSTANFSAQVAPVISVLHQLETRTSLGRKGRKGQAGKGTGKTERLNLQATAWVWQLGKTGTTPISAILRFPIPLTQKSLSTTASFPVPILVVPVMCQLDEIVDRQYANKSSSDSDAGPASVPVVSFAKAG